MSAKTGWLSGVPLSDEPPRPAYPPMTSQQQAVIEVIAEGLCVSVSSLAWAWAENDRETWRKLRKRLSIVRVELVADLKRGE